MKKTSIIIIVFLSLIFNANAAQKNMAKLIGGAALTGMGALLTYWGFSPKSVSIPEITMQAFSWTKNLDTTWLGDYSGTIRNSGNVDLFDIKLSITFKDINNIYISTHKINGPSFLAPGSNYSFSDSFDTGSTEPGYVSVSYSANFQEIYENRDLTIGISGLAVATCGLFFIADYFFNFTEPLKENNISIEITPYLMGVKFVTSKLF